MDGRASESKRLRRHVEWVLRRALDPAAVLPMLHRLSRLAADGTDEQVYAHRRLAEVLAEQHPWRGALYAKRVLSVQPSDDGAWSILALCHALLGNYRCAALAYNRALALAPANLAYAHNLGHLMDVALGRPREALPWLRAAYEGTDQRADVAVSFAHALGRAGEMAEARRVTGRALRVKDSAHAREHLALERWLAEGAPCEPGQPTLLPRRPPARVEASVWEPTREPGRSSASGPSRKARERGATALSGTLMQGLASLPLDAGQKGRARALAEDAWVVGVLRTFDSANASPETQSGGRAGARAGGRTGARTASQAGTQTALASLAAAIAYAVVYVDHVPLTQADVAACFRVSVPALRGRFKSLRSHLDLSPGNVRLATELPR